MTITPHNGYFIARTRRVVAYGETRKAAILAAWRLEYEHE